MKVNIKSQIEYAKKFKYMLATIVVPRGYQFSDVYEPALLDKARTFELKAEIKEEKMERFLFLTGKSNFVLTFIQHYICNYSDGSLENLLELNSDHFVVQDEEFTDDQIYKETGLYLFQNEGTDYDE